MNINVKGSDGLPKIMYDQSQFTPLYFMGWDSVWLNGNAYKLMQELSGYAPSVWYTYTQNKPVSFWFGAYDEQALQKEAENGFAYFGKHETVPYFEKVIEEYLAEATILREKFFADYLGKEEDALKNDPKDVADFIRQIHDLNSRLMGHYLLTQPQRFYEFEEKLKEHTADQDLAFVASNAHRLTFVSQVQRALLDKNYGEVDRLGFLNWGLLGGEVITRDTVVQEEQKEREKMTELEGVIEKRMRLLSNNPSPIYQLADIMGRAAVLRFDLQTIALCVLKYVDVLVEATRKLHGLTKDEISAYLCSELLELITDGKKIASTETDKRQLGCLMRYAEDGVSTYYATEAHEVIKELLDFRQKEIESTKEVKGSVASYPDKTVSVLSGECFVMTTAFEADTIIRDFKEGQILVATQTHPNVVPIMRLAKGIITDEGGITCHAAIVSRELGKPCIIGTRLGTKIFKTGDRVEMNLQTGTVKKI